LPPDNVIPAAHDIPQPPILLTEARATTPFVTKFFRQLPMGKSAGPDGLTPKLLKAAVDGFADYVTTLINRSLSSGVFPDLWKPSCAVPLYKKGERCEPGNYRPISLTQIISKCAESVVEAAIQNFDAEGAVTCPEQHAFRRGHSTETALISITDSCRAYMEKGEHVILCAVDFCKAFGSLDHQLLLKCIHRVGLRGPLYNWIESYLSNRQQCTVVNGTQSDFLPVVSGVPQGSVLGPRLFSLYINSLPLHLAETGIQCVLYADDLTLIAHGTTPSTSRVQLIAALQKLFAWSVQWRLAVHPNKCEVMDMASSKNSSEPLSLNICYNQVPIPNVTKMRLLGVTVDRGLTFVDHVTEVTTKAEQAVAILRRTTELPPIARRKLWLQKLLPTLTYAMSIWRDAPKLLVGRVDTLHRHAAKCVLRRGFQEDGRQALRDLGWDDLDGVYKKVLLRIGFLAARNKAPAAVQSHFRTPVQRGVPYSFAPRFIIPRSRPQGVFRHRVSTRAAQLWNKCDLSLKLLPSLQSLKNKLKKRDDRFVSDLYNFTFV
ncbi:MAG: reverse transcriptase family protein, partial [Gammaproteobacteria bacterium]|nr:reverse transcriptase family protein [Gammaproteobacteria bacterium]